MPEQADIDKILEIIRKKVLAQYRLLSKKAAMKRVEILAEKYILLDYLLFKLTTIPGKETALLVILEYVQTR